MSAGVGRKQEGAKFALIPEWVLRALTKDPSALALYCYLALHVYSEEGWAFSRKSLAEGAGMSLATLKRKLRVLIDVYAVHVDSTTLPNGDAGWNRYTVNRFPPGGVGSPMTPGWGHQRAGGGVTHEPHTTDVRKKTSKPTTAAAVNGVHKANRLDGPCLICKQFVRAFEGRLVGKAPAHLEGKCPRSGTALREKGMTAQDWSLK